jgi:hypothetical protein
MAIHHHETHGLFGRVIGGLDFRVGDEMRLLREFLVIFHWLV